MGKYGMNEIPIEKQFRQVSHAGEANQYARVTVPLPRRQYQPYDSGAGQIADGLGAFAKGATDLLGVIAEKKQESEKIADEVELTKLNNLVRQRLATISVTNDRELREGAQAFRDELAYQIANNENLSDRGRQQANLLLETAVGGYNAKGAAEIFRFRENQRKALAVNSINQAVESGDVPGVEKWFEDAIQHGVTPQYSKERYLSMAKVNAYLNHPYTRGLKISALDEELKRLDHVDSSGRNEDMPGIFPDDLDVIRKRLYSRRAELIASGQTVLNELTATGELTKQRAAELYLDGNISIAQYNGTMRDLKIKGKENGAELLQQMVAENRLTPEAVKNAYDSKLIDTEQYNAAISLSGQQRMKDMAHRRDSLSYGLLLTQFPADREDAKQVYSKWINDINAAELLPGQKRYLLEKLNTKYKDYQTPQGGLRGSFRYKHAMDVIAQKEKGGALTLGVSKTNWMGWRSVEQTGDPDFQLRRGVELREYMDQYLQNNPDVTVDQIDEEINKRITQLNQGEILNLYLGTLISKPEDALSKPVGEIVPSTAKRQRSESEQKLDALLYGAVGQTAPSPATSVKGHNPLAIHTNEIVDVKESKKKMLLRLKDGSVIDSNQYRKD